MELSRMSTRTAPPDNAGPDAGGWFLVRPRLLVRLEGLTALALAVWWYAAAGGGHWVLFAVLFFVPDLSMLGYRWGPRVGAATYNLVHTYAIAGILAAVGVASGYRLFVELALILTAHIGMDRLLGYGLKYPRGFNDTHLQHL
jgi:Domain of unknown function (DUF4260)